MLYYVTRLTQNQKDSINSILQYAWEILNTKYYRCFIIEIEFSWVQQIQLGVGGGGEGALPAPQWCQGGEAKSTSGKSTGLKYFSNDNSIKKGY